MELRTEFSGRWISPEVEDVYKKYEELREKVIADFRAKYDFKGDRITALEASRLPRTAEDAARIDAEMRANLEPIHRKMAELKAAYWLPIITLTPS